MTLQKAAGSLLKRLAVVNWSPKKKPTQSEFLPIFSSFSKSVSTPGQLKAEARRLSKHQFSFVGQREEVSEATTQEASFLSHCQQPLHKGIETKKKFQLTRHSWPRLFQKVVLPNVTLFTRDTLIFRNKVTACSQAK